MEEGKKFTPPSLSREMGAHMLEIGQIYLIGTCMS